MFKRILVPLDGSKLAERAIPHASHLARVFDAQIQLLQVLDSTPYQETPNATEPLNWQIHKAQADLYLSGAAGQIRAGGITAEHFLREGKTAEGIIDFAQQEGSDLLVISTHGSSGLSRWNLSSVASKVVNKICLPVMVIRSYQQPTVAEPEAAAEEDLLLTAERAETESENGEAASAAFYQKILLPIDTSRRAECAIPAAVTLAQQGAQILLAAVIQPPSLPIPGPYPEEFHQFIERFLDLSRNAVKAYLEEQKKRIPNVETRIVENSNISAAIHDMAEQEGIDLVVLCAHGQTGGTLWPYGSVARNYIEHGAENVLVVQDIPCSQIRITAAEVAAEKTGRR